MIWLLVLCVISLVAAVALFLQASVRRRDLDDVLVAAATKAGGPRARLLGMFERWEPDGPPPAGRPVALAVPERRWTYERDYMRAFIDAIAGKPVPGKPGESWLSIYAGPILGWDMAFAAAFACFIVLAWATVIAALPANWLWGWAPRACLVFAALGAVYGVADIAEDVKLRHIFRTAREIGPPVGGAAAPPPPRGVGRNFDPEAVVLTETPGGGAAAEPRPTRPEPLDDAEVDAANALTRLKLVTITFSVIGFLAFLSLAFAGEHLPRHGEAAKDS
jgi:hypothetical protein